MSNPQHLQELDSEIELLEKQFSSPQEEESPTATENEEVEELEVEDEGSEELPPDPTEESNEDLEDDQDSEDATEQDSLDVKEEEDKPQPKTPRRNDWKKRYKSLRSHHDTLVYELRKEISDLKSSLVEVTKKNHELFKQMETISSKEDDASLLTEDERELLGEETLSALKKLTSKSVDPLRKQLEEERALRLKMQEDEAKRLKSSTQKAFVERFSKLVPDYITIDKDPKFLEFMQDIDVASGYDRTTLFKRAVQNGDVVRAAGFYQEYLQKTKKVDPLAHKITPTGKQSSVVKEPQKKEIISYAYINQFYDDVVRGKYKGKASLEREIEAKIDKAIVEGRVK